MNLNNYSTIILDCDGVIFDSNYLKIDAFRGALSVFDQEIVEEFICYVKVNFGTSRFYLIKVFLKDFLKIEFSEDLYQNILNAYSKNCVSLYGEKYYIHDFAGLIHNRCVSAKGKAEHTPFIDFTLHPYSTAMRFYQPLAY